METMTELKSPTERTPAPAGYDVATRPVASHNTDRRPHD